MGRGNVCVTGDYEGLFYIDNDDLLVYRRKDSDPEDEDFFVMLGAIEYQDMNKYEYDEFESELVWDEVLWELKDGLKKRFHSFTECNEWISRERHAILENNLFYVCVQDNEWSTAVMLIQKEHWCYDLSGLQSKHYQTYLDGIRDVLFERFESLSIYSGAWTSGTIRREEQKKCS